MSVKGFRYDGQIHRYLYGSLEGIPDDMVFWATYNTTTSDEIEAAINEHKIVVMNYLDNIYYYSGKGSFGPTGTAHLFFSFGMYEGTLRILSTWVAGDYWNPRSPVTFTS